MSATTSQARPTFERTVASALLPIMAAVLIAFVVIGMALPVLPLHVHKGLGLNTFLVGLISGSQFLAALLSRVWAGRFADRRGGKRAVIGGLLATIMGGLLYLVSLRFPQLPELSAVVLLIGRALIGCGESFVITGGISWGFALLGPTKAGRIIAWIGMAMFAAFALGAPLGTMLYDVGGYAAISWATLLFPMAALVLVAPLTSTQPQNAIRPSILKVMANVWMPGLGAACASIGLGTMISFSPLLIAERNWGPAWLLFSAFAMALVMARLFLGHLPDKLGGARVALISIVIEAFGLALVWWSPAQGLAVAGAVLTGLGFALVYPALGVEAVRRTPAHSRGLAMGAYTAFLDVALGFGSPALGIVAGRSGLASVFLSGALIVLAATGIAGWLLCSSEQAGKDA